MPTDKINEGYRKRTFDVFKELLRDFSIEVMPRTLARVSNLASLFPNGTRTYIAHIEGVDIRDMVKTAKLLTDNGYRVMPHFPARLIKDEKNLELWIKSYTLEAGISEALLLAGSPRSPLGTLDNSMQLLDSGLFDKHGFTRLHIAGHPEGNKDIEHDCRDGKIAQALKWKQMFSERTDAEMAIVTQFSFCVHSIVKWAEALKAENIDLPIHVGIAGPTKLNALIKFALSCGVGPSVKVLQKRAADLSKLLLPYEPSDILRDLKSELSRIEKSNITNIHFFPLGGIQASADWIKRNRNDPQDAFLDSIAN